jgi:ribonuclease HII
MSLRVIQPRRWKLQSLQELVYHLCGLEVNRGQKIEMPDFELERQALAKDHRLVAGLDEAGRGALFGPVVAAAVVFPPALIISEVQGWMQSINDSKQLTARQRRQTCRLILMHAEGVGWGLASHSEIDRINIHRASLESMKRALDSLVMEPDFVLVDGFKLNNVQYSHLQVRQGDRKSLSIAAASIVAKVLRDEIIIHLDSVFEGYKLAKHKGYGTREHYEILRRLGPTVFHRKTFNLKDRTES